MHMNSHGSCSRSPGNILGFAGTGSAVALCADDLTELTQRGVCFISCAARPPDPGPEAPGERTPREKRSVVQG